MSRAPGPAHRRPAPPAPPPALGLPGLPPDLHWSNRIDLAMHTASAVGPSGYLVGPWLEPDAPAGRHAEILRQVLDTAAGESRVENPHLARPSWLQRVVTGRHPLDLPRTLLGPDLAIESSRLYTRDGTRPGAIPLHQDQPEHGTLDPRFALTGLYLIGHTGSAPFARVAPHSHAHGHLPHEPHSTVAFGELPRLVRDDGRRWWQAEPAFDVGDVLYLDPRTLRTFGTPAAWIVLAVTWIAPPAVLYRPVGAPPVLRMCGQFTRWHDPAALGRARVHSSIDR
jgi:hypothetical protein